MAGAWKYTARASVRATIAAAAATAMLVGGVIAEQPAAASGPVTATAVGAGASDVASEITLAGPVRAADLSKFHPGNIISDAVFFDKNTMTETQIQGFLQSKVPSCQSGYTCLKDWYDTSRTTSADAMCGAYSGGVRERASRIIYKVAQACGINPQVILATLQKEQGLVTHVWPSEWRYTIAMGQGCPDTAACDTRYYGFFNQVFGAAWQLKRYANPPGTSQYFTWYAPGRTWNVRWHPNAACGSSPVYIQNQATANLYYYTPYQPNAAALRAGYGTGDGCSSYGNRNFYQYFTDWFGSTQIPVNACAQPAASAVTAADGEFVVDVASLNARSAPSTACEPIVRSLSQGTIVTRTGVYGEWWRVRIAGVHYWVHGSYLRASPAVAWTTNRVAGETRYETAVEVSRVANPSGAPVVFLASGGDFPDALAAAAAASRSGGSLLLTGADALPAAVRSEIARLAPSRIVVVGGSGVVSDAVMAEASALRPTAQTTRVGGEDRYETSRMLAQAYFAGSATAYVATGVDFADALAASAVAGAQNAPVILVDGRAAAPVPGTLETLRTIGTSSVIIAGGPGAISGGIASTFASHGMSVTRYGGVDRYETGRLINAAAYPGATSTALLTTGADFPDALTGAVLAGRTKAPMFSQPPTCMTGAVKDWLIGHGVKTVRLVGGSGALSDAVAKSARC